MLYADIILPVPLNQTFTYIIPDELEKMVQIGQRVLAPFGRNHTYTGIIVGLTPHRPETGYELKPIQQVLDEGPIIRHPQYPLWQWIANYYMCPIGDVMKAALPSELKPEEGKEGTVREDFQPKMRTMVQITLPGIEDSSSPITPSSQNTQSTPITPTTPTTPKVQPSSSLESAFKALQRSPQQQALFMKLLDMSHALQKAKADPVPKDVLLKSAGVSTAIFNEVHKKGLLTTFEEPVSRLDTRDDPYLEQRCEPMHPLTEMQTVAYRQICLSLRDHQVCLLQGVTSSGKTEIYMHLIQEVIEQGRQALLMVPEIALTTQLCQRLRRVFGKQMLVYHSKLSDTERVEIWKAMLDNSKGAVQSSRLIVGVRSSIFLPFRQLGLVIVDEEHEPSYKQQDPAPRYHGRDTAIILAMRHGAKVLLGSATPSLESFYLAKQGKYGLVRLTERHAGVSLPKITLVPTKDVFSPELVKKIGHTLQQGQQAILFQNRRGYSSQIECVQCGWTPHCPRCDVSLTYHKRTRALECHYCGYRMPWPQICPQCEGRQLETQGYGTERIEEGLQRLLPIARPIRMDTDSTGTRKSYERIIQDFEQKKCNVLIGTQMVTKGLDFSSVQTVGILSADGLMNFPDFRAHERAFQLMEQVAGRAGRREGQQGEVIIQCRDPKNLLLQQVVSHDYLAMAESQLEDRRRYGYPPFTRLIIIYMKGRYEDRLDAMVAKYVQQLRYTFGERVLGPEAPPIGRVKNMFIRQVLLKVEREASTSEIRRLLGIIQSKLSQDIQEFSRIVFYYDVDPM